MSWKLPPLNALRAFEAAARAESFTAAARELHVTPGAVSRQVKLLEEYLGVTLFERGHRELSLTRMGKQYHDAAFGALGTLHRATSAILERGRSRPLQIWSSLTFSMRWLVPRLSAYQIGGLGRDVVLTTSLKPIDFSTGEIDLAIRYGTGHWPGLVALPLVRTDLIPVCSPELATAEPLVTPTDLLNHTLLHSTVRIDDWPRWLKAAGVDDRDPGRGVRFESSSLAYQAAIQGLGVALGQRALVWDDLKAQRLIAPLDFALQSEGAFYLIYQESASWREDLLAFRDWILAEAARCEAERLMATRHVSAGALQA